MAKMNRLSVIPFLLLLVSHPAHSRSIREDLSSEGRPSFLDLRLSAATETCEPVYGFLPCSTNVGGLLFLIVMYEILLSQGAKYVGIGSELFFQTIGDGIFGANLFQFLGTIPQIVLVLVSAFSGSVEAAQQRATLGMGLVAGTTVMLLTLIWGITIILGSVDLSEDSDESGREKTTSKCAEKSTPKCYGVVTEAKTRYAARIMLITLIPFLIILLANIFNSSSWKRAINLFALIVTVILLFAYIFYQIFKPLVHDWRFEYLMNKYAKDKLLRLVARNGKADTEKITELFRKIDEDKSQKISPSELRVFLLGVDTDDDDLSTGMDVEHILLSFDTNKNEGIELSEFLKGMEKLVPKLSRSKNGEDEAPNRVEEKEDSSSQNSSQLQQGLLANSNSNSTSTSTSTSTGTGTGTKQKASNSWLNYLEAAFFVIVGTVVLCALAQPLIDSVVAFAEAANLPSFSVSYLAIPFAMNYGIAVQSIAFARRKTKKSIYLSLSALYGGVYMNNVISLIVFLAPVYALNLSVDVFAEVLVVLAICIFIAVLTSSCTTFPRWMGYLVVLLYPISLALIFSLTSILGWP